MYGFIFENQEESYKLRDILASIIARQLRIPYNPTQADELIPNLIKYNIQAVSTSLNLYKLCEIAGDLYIFNSGQLQLIAKECTLELLYEDDQHSLLKVLYKGSSQGDFPITSKFRYSVIVEQEQVIWTRMKGNINSEYYLFKSCQPIQRFAELLENSANMVK